MAYGIKYQGQFKSIINQDYTVNILEDGYSGSIEQLDVTDKAVWLQYSYDGERRDPLFCLRPLQCTMHIPVTTDYKFREFFVADDEQFKIEVKKDSTLIFSGFLMPDLYQEEYSVPFIAKVRATDGMGTLKQKYLDSYSGRTDVMSLLTEIFRKIDPVWKDQFGQSLIYELIQSYPDHITASDPVLENVEVDRENYTRRTEERPDAERMNCYEILDEIVNSFNVSIQKGINNRFEVFEPLARAEDTVSWKRYSDGGNGGALTYTQDINSSSYHIKNGDAGNPFDFENDLLLTGDNHTLNIYKAIKQVDVKANPQHTSEDLNLTPNGLFRPGTEANTGFLDRDYSDTGGAPPKWTKSDNSANGMVLDFGGGANRLGDRDSSTEFVWLKIRADTDQSTAADFIQSQNIPVFSDQTYNFFTSFWYKGIDLDLSIGEHVKQLPLFAFEVKLQGDSGTTYYLQKDGNGDFVLDTPTSKVLTRFQWGTEMVPVEVNDLSMPEGGDLQILIYGAYNYTAKFKNASGNWVEGERRPSDLFVGPAKLTLANGLGIKRSQVRERSGIAYSTETYERSVMHLDSVPAVATTGEVTDGSGNVTGGWKRSSFETGVSLLRNIARVVLDTYDEPHYRLTGTLRHAEKPDNFFDVFTLEEDSTTRTLIPVQGTFHLGSANLQSLELIEIDKQVDFDPTNVFNDFDWNIREKAHLSGELDVKIGQVNSGDSDYDFENIRVQETTTDNEGQVTSPPPPDPANEQKRTYLSDGTDGFNEGDEVIKFTDSAGNTTTNKRMRSGDNVSDLNNDGEYVPKSGGTFDGAVDINTGAFSTNVLLNINGIIQFGNLDTGDVGFVRYDSANDLIEFSRSGTGDRDIKIDASGNIKLAENNSGNVTINGNTAWHDGNVSTGSNIDISGRTISVVTGQSNGVAALDANGKVPSTQLPNSIMEYKGTWNADTNTPSLSDGTGNAGDVYRVSVAGTHDFGSGAIEFDVGDYVIYNASDQWEKSDTTDSVPTVFGRAGNVTAQSGDYDTSQVPENGNLYFTNSRADARVQNAINDSGAANDELWSSSKISTELGDKQDSGNYAERDDNETITGSWTFDTGNFEVLRWQRSGQNNYSILGFGGKELYIGLLDNSDNALSYISMSDSDGELRVRPVAGGDSNDRKVWHEGNSDSFDNSGTYQNLRAQSTTKGDVGLGNVTNDAQLKIASNLSDLGSASTARNNLGLGTAATKDESNLSITESQISDLGNYNEFARTVVNSDSYTIDAPSAGECYVIDSAPEGGGYTITLDESMTAGTLFIVGDETGNAGGSFSATIDTSGSATINGANSRNLGAYQYFFIYFNGTNFFVISSN